MKISIPEPCQADWSQMNEAEKGKHCAQCDKVVIDFTTLNDAQIIQYMNSNPGTCGKFLNNQLDRDLSPSIFHKRNWAGPFAASVAAAAQLVPNHAKAQNVMQTGNMMQLPVISNQQNPAAAKPETRVFTIRNNSNDSVFDQLSRIVIDIDSFQIPMDTFSNGIMRFTLPQSLSWELFELHFYHKESTDMDSLQIKKEEVYNAHHNTIDFSIQAINGKWQVNRPVFMPYIPEIVTTMGLAPWGPEVPYWNDSLYRVTVFPLEYEVLVLGNTMGWTSMGDTTVDGPSAMQIESEPLDSTTANNPKKDGISKDPYKWTWIFGILMGFAALLAAFVFTGKKKNK